MAEPLHRNHTMKFEKGEKMEKKKLNLAGCILMGIGCIIGSGIFGTMPTVAAQIGPGIVYALLGAAGYVIIKSLATLYVSAALPITAASFMHTVKLIHPCAGLVLSINYFLQPTMVSLFGVLFGTYFKELVPGLLFDTVFYSVGLLVVFTCIAWFGNHSTVNISNLMVVILLAAIGFYVVLGMTNIDPENVSFMSIVRPGVSLSAISACIGTLSSSLSGASSVAELANDVENPERNVPLALILCPVIVAVVYILMAVVTIGVIPAAEVETLSQVASHFMSPGLLVFFIVGGPIAGIITSLVPVALACVAGLDFASRQKVYPEIFSKKNRHGVPVVSLFIVSGIAVGICATGATFGVVMTIFSFANTLSGVITATRPIFAHKKYPLTCDNSTAHMSVKAAWVISVLYTALSAYLCVEMLRSLKTATAAGVICVYLIGICYMVCRVLYLKRKGINLIEEMKKPYEPWEEKERAYREGESAC